jgi:hypothetical protein
MINDSIRSDMYITFWNISDFGVKCEKSETINSVTLEEGELKKQV